MFSKKKLTKKKCITWLYAPQVDENNLPYAFGISAVDSKWDFLMNNCMSYMKEYFHPFYTPERLYELFTSPNLENPDGIFETINISVQRESSEPEKLRKIINSILLTIGISDSQYNNTITDILRKIYIYVYNICGKFPLLQTQLVKPDNIRKLFDQGYQRPGNPLLNITKTKTHTNDLLSSEKCPIDILDTCSTKFTISKKTIFTKFIEHIQCYCSLLKQKLKYDSSIRVTSFDKRDLYDIITPSDSIYLQTENSDTTIKNYTYPPIIIEKYKENALCEEKNYISQLFSKVCPLLYKKPKLFSIENNDDYNKKRYQRYNIIISNTPDIYYDGHLNIFETIFNEKNKVKIPVYFKTDTDFYPEDLPGPTKQFFTDIMSELVTQKVFIETDTLFNNRRYELNINFDIETLECYKNLSKKSRSQGYKVRITEYFFEFIGYLLHFAVINNIELPFSLSRVYIAQLFGVYDFLSPKSIGDPKQELKAKVVLISLYLMEKASPQFVNYISRILENPTLLETDSEIKAVLAPLRNTNEQIHMNDLYTIVDKAHDLPLFTTDQEVLFNNILEFLYKIAIKSYTQELDNNYPASVQNYSTYLKSFFNGFRIGYREFSHETYTSYYKSSVEFFNKLDKFNKLSAIRKLDVYLSGFGIQYKTIKDLLLPNINIYKFEENGYITTPIEKLNSIPNSLYQPDTVNSDDYNIIIGYWLQRILLNKGVDISKEFIDAYNNRFKNKEKLTDEEYHNEFVKYLLKTWSGFTNINTNMIYKFIILPHRQMALPVTHTCFTRLDILQKYESVVSFYTDLVKLIIFTNFGETLVGGKISISKKTNIKKRKSKLLTSSSLRL